MRIVGRETAQHPFPGVVPGDHRSARSHGRAARQGKGRSRSCAGVRGGGARSAHNLAGVIARLRGFDLSVRILRCASV